MATENQEENTTQENKSPNVIEHNLRFYEMGREVPADAIKPIQAGRLRGKSDINPMWRTKRMTEIFGPCGFGWKYTIDRQWQEQYGDEVKCFCNVSLFVRDPETREWSDAIPGNGGSTIVSKEGKGPYVNDEGYKMALTDALSIAMKPLGIGANIWYGPKATGHNESKYEYETQMTQQNQQTQNAGATAVSQEDLMKQAIAEMNAVTTEQQFQEVWITWSNSYPAICQNTTDFYKVASNKINKIRGIA